jgi:hypothetical protein
MATTRILYSQTTQTGKSIAQAVNAVLEARAAMARAKALLDQAMTGDDQAAVAGEVGLNPATQTQEAYDLWYIVSTVSDALHAPVVDQLARLDQG